MAVESVAGYKDTWSTLKDILKGRRIVHKVTVSKDMVVRAAPLEPVFESGNVHLLRGEWNAPFLTHFGQFPAGAHDDIVAAVVGGYEMLRKPVAEAVDRRLLGF